MLYSGQKAIVLIYINTLGDMCLCTHDVVQLLFSSSELETIFSTILSPHLSPTSGAGAGVGEVGERLVQMAVQVHSRLSPLFLPSPRRQHYLFNLRHIAGIFR